METVSVIYEKIGNYINSNIGNVQWREARLLIDIVESSVGFEGFFNENERYSTPANFALAKSILELHKITTKGDHNRWNRAIFKLWPEGKFDMEFIWDQELHDELDSL